jgi:ATP-dependent Lon protease
MSKIVKKSSSQPFGKGAITFGMGGRMGRPDTSELEEKINSKNLPPHVK